MSKSFKMLTAALLLLLAFGAVGYFAVLPKYEKEMADRVVEVINALPGDLKADEVKVGFIGKKFVITGLKGKTVYIEGSSVEVNIGRISGAGINLEAGQKPGVAPLLDSLVFTDIKLASASSPEATGGMEFDTQVGEMRFAGIKCDLHAILQAASATNTPEERARYVSALTTIHVDASSAKEYVSSLMLEPGGRPIAATLASLEYKDFSPLKYGPVVGKDLKMDFGDGDHINMELVSIQAMDMPDVFTYNLTAGDDEKGEAALRMFAEKRAIIKGLSAEKASIRFGNCESVFDKFTISLEAGLRESARDTQNPEPTDLEILFKDFSVTGAKGANPYPKGTMTYSIGNLSLNTYDVSAMFMPGGGQWVDQIQFRDVITSVASHMEGIEAPFKQEATIKEMNFKGISGDLSPLVLAIMQEGAPTSETALIRMMSALTTIRIAESNARGYETQLSFTPGIPPLKLSLDSFEYRDFGLLSYGPMVVEKLSVDMGDNSLGIGRLSSDSIQFPDIFALSLKVRYSGAPEKELLEELEKQPLILKGLELENFFLKLAPHEESTLAKARMSLEFGASKQLWQHAIDGLVIPSGLYAALNEQGAVLAAEYGKPLMLSSKVDVESRQENGKGDIIVKEAWLDEKNLAFLSVNAELPFEGKGQGTEGLLANGATVFLKEANAVLEDRGLVNTSLAVQFKSMQAQSMLAPDSTPDTLRNSMIQTVRSLGQFSASPDQKVLFDGLAKLLGAPGKLNIAIKPDQPVTLESLTGGGPRMPLNLAADYIPAQ